MVSHSPSIFKSCLAFFFQYSDTFQPYLKYINLINLMIKKSKKNGTIYLASMTAQLVRQNPSKVS